MIKMLLATTLVFSSQGALAEIATASAPEGSPVAIASRAISDSEQPCGKVNSAARDADGVITALCTNGERYAVLSVEGAGTVAIMCSAARALMKKQVCQAQTRTTAS